MASEWPVCKLEDVSEELTVGYVGPMTDQYTDTGVLFLRSLNIRPFGLDTADVKYISPDFHATISKSSLQAGDVVIVRTGRPGTCAVIPEGLGAVNCSDLVIVRCGDALRPHFLCYWVNAIGQHHVSAYSVGAVQQHFNVASARLIELPVPPLPEQDRVLSVLCSLDDRIDNLRAINATLEAIAQALFKSWFVDFDPVHAKAKGREPEAIDAATAALFPSEFEESELGAIPKGWRVDEIGNVVKCLGGATPSTKEDAYWTDGEHHWVTPKDLAGLQAPILTATSRRITDAGLSRISSGLLPRGTLLMSSRAPIGYLALAGIPAAINQGFIAMPPGGTLPPVYLFFWTRANMDSIKQKANGSTFMEISKSAFRPIKFCVPSPKLVDAFVAVASPLMDRIETNELHRVALTELRDTLLPRLISGKLRLPEATEATEAALA
jgi:type I restriction enzyme S subunit